jgi:phage anti-repressor protein
MNELVKVSKSNIGEHEVNSVNAKELHAFLESKQQFSNWIVNRITKYGFIENKDYLVNKFINNAGQVIESNYIITFDMAKHLGLVENNIKGKEIRNYFIMIEEKYNEQKQQFINKPLIELLPEEIMQIKNKSLLTIAKDQADFFKLEDTGRMLWGQSLLLKNNLPCPNIPLLTNININLYGISEIYDKFNIRGKNARIKQQAIKAILSEFQNDSEYAVKCMFTSKSGHTDMMYKYTDKSIELIQSKIESINNI